MSGPRPIRVCAFESRRASEIQSLIERHGGQPLVAPSMREVPLDRNTAAFAFADSLLAGRIDAMIFLTGVGARALLETVETRIAPSSFFEALNRIPIAVRGPKPVAVLREWGVRIDLRAPEPNTWRELLATVQAAWPLQGQTIAVQEYGVSNAELTAALTKLGANIVSVPVYRWELPENLEPLQRAIRAIVAGELDVLLFTSAQQIHHVLQVAETLGLAVECRAAMDRCFIGSIGPTCSEALTGEGLAVGHEASPPKMGQLVRDTLAAFAATTH